MYDSAATHEAILSAAKQEFSERGFLGASLREIARRAGVTTGALYQHHKDKNALFSALVGGVAEENRRNITDMCEGYLRAIDAVNLSGVFSLEQSELYAYMDDLYAHHEAFHLLLCKASGSAYKGYLDEIVALYSQMNIAYVDSLMQRGLCRRRPTDESIRVMSRAYVVAVYAVITDGVAQRDARAYADDLVHFFDAGWMRLLGV